MVFQGTSGELTKKPIACILPETKTNLPLEASVVLKILWIPVRIRIDEETRGPESPVFPTHRTVSPQRKYRRILHNSGGRKKRSDISWRKESSDRMALKLRLPDPHCSHRHKGLRFLIPSNRNPSWQCEHLAPPGKRNQFLRVGKEGSVAGTTGQFQVGVVKDLSFRI
jgi:hypothetical protein